MITRVIREGLEGLVLKDVKVRHLFFRCVKQLMKTGMTRSLCVRDCFCPPLHLRPSVCPPPPGLVRARQASLAEGEEGLPERGRHGRHGRPGGAGRFLRERLQRCVIGVCVCVCVFALVCVVHEHKYRRVISSLTTFPLFFSLSPPPTMAPC